MRRNRRRNTGFVCGEQAVELAGVFQARGRAIGSQPRELYEGLGPHGSDVSKGFGLQQLCAREPLRFLVSRETVDQELCFRCLSSKSAGDKLERS